VVVVVVLAIVKKYCNKLNLADTFLVRYFQYVRQPNRRKDSIYFYIEFKDQNETCWIVSCTFLLCFIFSVRPLAAGGSAGCCCFFFFSSLL